MASVRAASLLISMYNPSTALIEMLPPMPFPSHSLPPVHLLLSSICNSEDEERPVIQVKEDAKLCTAHCHHYKDDESLASYTLALVEGINIDTLLVRNRTCVYL